MNPLPLDTFLARRIQSVGESRVLEVCCWESHLWSVVHSIGLAHICRRLKIETLIFGGRKTTKGVPADFFSLLESHADASYPRLPDLKEIKIFFSEKYPLFMTLWRYSRASRIIFECESMNMVTFFPQERFGSFFGDVRNILIYNLYLRELRFELYGEPLPILKQSGYWSSIDRSLVRNQKIHEKCQAAVTTLLSLRRRKENGLFSLIGRDVASLLIQMVWDTRGTNVWIDENRPKSSSCLLM